MNSKFPTDLNISVVILTHRRLNCSHSYGLTEFLSPSFNGHFPGGPGLTDTRMSPFWILLELRVMEMAVTTEAIKTCKSPIKMSPPANQRPAFLTDRNYELKL